MRVTAKEIYGQKKFIFRHDGTSISNIGEAEGSPAKKLPR
ncbi:hypothetical protein B4135_0349 [Caldibacillus debilis]|uniref:Uncharacterized protein n=1 Tax=Caldibacillus debilis TaxID=301148 RepID=A0A150M4W1_9BACI|nr:hypothetical protein B4135_0349 [Caldibacillus debilis]